MLECLNCSWIGDEQELINGKCPVCQGEVWEEVFEGYSNED